MNAKMCRCGCGASLAGMRSDAEWRTPACRMRAQRAASTHKARTRLPSRDGKGIRIYLTEHELARLTANEITDSVWRKAQNARYRRDQRRTR